MAWTDGIRILVEGAEGPVAAVAERGPDEAALVVVVHLQCRLFAADRADPTLGLDECGNLIRADPIPIAEVIVAAATLPLP